VLVNQSRVTFFRIILANPKKGINFAALLRDKGHRKEESS
jgi:hypothetical protein